MPCCTSNSSVGGYNGRCACHFAGMRAWSMLAVQPLTRNIFLMAKPAAWQTSGICHGRPQPALWSITAPLAAAGFVSNRSVCYQGGAARRARSHAALRAATSAAHLHQGMPGKDTAGDTTHSLLTLLIGCGCPADLWLMIQAPLPAAARDSTATAAPSTCGVAAVAAPTAAWATARSRGAPARVAGGKAYEAADEAAGKAAGEAAGPGPGSATLPGFGLDRTLFSRKQQLEPGLYLVATPIGNLQVRTAMAGWKVSSCVNSHGGGESWRHAVANSGRQCALLKWDLSQSCLALSLRPQQAPGFHLMATFTEPERCMAAGAKECGLIHDCPASTRYQAQRRKKVT